MRLGPTPAPAQALIRADGDLLAQLGARTVEAKDDTTVVATYFDNAAAVNAEALLNDTIRGARLVIDNQSRTADVPIVSAHGIERLLRGVAGLDVNVANAAGGRKLVTGTSHDPLLVHALSELVDPHPTDEIDVAFHAPVDIALG